MDSKQVIFWKRKDVESLERLVLNQTEDAVHAVSSVISLENGGLRVDLRWKLSRNWRTESLEVKKWNVDVFQRLLIERSGRFWNVNGMPRMDLIDTVEPDLSVSPFSNSLPIRRMKAEKSDSLTMAVCYIDLATMEVRPSKQRYQRTAVDKFQFFEQGVARGFEAIITVDQSLIVTDYQNLFERTYPR